MSERLFWAIMAASVASTIILSTMVFIVNVPVEGQPNDEGMPEIISLNFNQDEFEFEIKADDAIIHNDSDFVRQFYSSLSTSRFVVSDSVIDALMDVLDEKIEKMSDLEKAKALLEFVYVNIMYKSDDRQFGYSEYIQYPSETLLHKKGDCEDMASLLYILYEKAGLDAVLIHCDNHVAVGVDTDAYGKTVTFRGKEYTISDPTSSLGLGNTALEGIWFVDKADNPFATNLILVEIVAVQLFIGFVIFTQWRLNN